MKVQLRRFERFFKAEASGGLVMLAATLVAMILANSEYAAWYHDFIQMQIGFSAGPASVLWPVSLWVQDVLMVLFFLVVGMELKREMREGFLSNRQQVLLPLAAAVGGMVAPAVIFLAINRHVPEHMNGWAIPSATDIAFALCILMLVGKKVPPALKIFLLAIAIFDDLGAILIIAFFYSDMPGVLPLLLTAGCGGLLYWLNRAQVMIILPYILTGIALWFTLHAGGIHTTIAGVMVGMAIPLRNPKESSDSPLNTCMHFLHPWVSFGVLPLFAFTAAGVNLEGLNLSSMLSPLVLGITAGLFVGKQIGIFGATWIVVKTKHATLPEGSGWQHIYGVSLLAGIGFTMSLFIGALAFPTELQEQVKLGVLAGSLLSAILGWAVLRWTRA